MCKSPDRDLLLTGCGYCILFQAIIPPTGMGADSEYTISIRTCKTRSGRDRHTTSADGSDDLQVPYGASGLRWGEGVLL